MKVFVYFLLVLFSTTSLAKDYESINLDSILFLKMFEETNILDISKLPDFIDREEKVSACVEEYKARQSRSYARAVQKNLYDLIHNFEGVISRITGNRRGNSDVSLEDKIDALAKMQCDIYYSMGVLK